MNTNIAQDEKTGIFYRPTTFDEFILKESRSYFPMNLAPNDMVLDIGGHIGCFLSRVLIESPGCPIVSIEPEESNYAVLEKNCGYNTEVKNPANTNVVVLRGAVVNSKNHGSEISLYVNKKNNNATHSVVQTNGRDVQNVSGFGFFQIMQEFPATVIKCDIEGGEYDLDWEDVLKANPQVRMIVLELHLTKKGHRDLAKQLIATIESCGFKADKVPTIGEKNWTTIAKWTR